MMSEQRRGWQDRVAAHCTRERVQRYPATIFVVFLLVWLGGYLLGSKDRVLDAWGKFLGNDFVAFYTGARFWLDGRLASVYDLEQQHLFQAALTAAGEVAQTSPFINPPYAVVWYAPFAAMGDYLWALIAWLVCGVALFVASVRGVHLEGELPGRGVMMAQLLLAPPFLLWLGYGQATAVVFFWLAMSYGAMRRGRWVWGGAALGMLAFKPQLALGLVLVIVGRRRWGALAAGASVLALWVGLGFALSPEAMAAWWSKSGEWAAMLREESYPAWGVCSIYGFYNLLVYPLSPRLADALTALSSAALLGWLVRCVWRVRDAAWESEEVQATVAIVLMCAPLLAVQYYTYDLLLCVLPVWIVTRLCVARRGQGDERGAASPYLDGGAVLAWTAILYGVTFLGPVVIGAQVAWFEQGLGLPGVSVQIVPLVAIGWSAAVQRKFLI